MSCPSLTRFGEIGTGYPTNVYKCNRLLLPILRQKMALSDVQYDVFDLPYGCQYGDQNTWNTIQISGQKIRMSN
jgi:hypothetical protein